MNARWRSIRVKGAIRLAVLLSLLTAAQVSAQEVGLDIDLGVPDAAGDQYQVGWGGQLRIGDVTDVGIGNLALEGALDYYRFPLSEAGVAADLFRVTAGVRLGFALPLAPAIFAHVGYGAFDGSEAFPEASASGLTWDVGLAAELFTLDSMSVGLHAAFKSISEYEDDRSAPSIQWFGLGLHGAFDL